MSIIKDFINSRCFIIAEGGVNHNGNINIAIKLIDAAKAAGANAIKFQTFTTDSLVSKTAPTAKYQQQTTGENSQYNMLKSLELSFEEHLTLKEYCNNKGILFLSTPFDFESVDLLERVGILLYKVSSGDLTNTPLLSYIARNHKPMILSTGMANLAEVEQAVESIKDDSNNEIILLHCTSNYPTDFKDVNLNAMQTLQEAFKLPVGYSDHTLGIEVPIAAVAMGAKVIEKHITLDKRMDGPDHKVSLDPIEFKNMVDGIRNIEKAMGDGIKRCAESERPSKFVSRKSIIAKTKIMKDETISWDMLSFKRPEKGISPQYATSVVGKKALVDIEKDTFISWDEIQ